MTRSLSPASIARITTLVHSSTAHPHSTIPRVVVLACSSLSPSLLSCSSGLHTLSTPSISNSELKDNAVTPESVFDLFSCTKLVTVISALQLMEEGKIDLEDDAGEYLEELSGVKVLRKEGRDEEGRKVTVRQLMVHTAGFTYEGGGGPHAARQAAFRKEKGYELGVPTEESIKGMPPMYTPGERWNYGTSNDWLGLLVEKVSGMGLEEYFQTKVFQPLGITDMSYVATSACVEMAVAPVPPSTTYTTRPIDFTPKSHNFGGAGLRGSASSYLRILRALLCGGTLDGQTLLSPSTVDMMFTPQLTTDLQKRDVADFTRGFLEPFSRRRGTAFEGVNWGLGGALSGKGLPSGRSDACLTWFGFANTYWVLDKEKDIALVLFTNIVPARSDRMFELWEAVEPEIYKGLSSTSA